MHRSRRFRSRWLLLALLLAPLATAARAQFCLTEEDYRGQDHRRAPSLDSFPAQGPQPLHGVAVTTVLWRPGQTIRIRFLDGDPYVQGRVRHYAEQWLSYANLRFQWVDGGASDIRISFRDSGSYSLLGTECRHRAQDQATMNFGWFDRQTAEAEFRRTTLHEFGHALGLGHEHKSPVHRIRWNEPLVIADMRRTHGWDEAKTRHNILERLDATTTRSSTFDPASIMAYSVPERWTLDGFSLEQSTDLSPGDREFIRQLYPSDSPVRPPPPTQPPTTLGPVELTLANTAVPHKDGKTWEWQAFVKGNGLEQVSHVVYHLHPTFPNPDRRVDASAGYGFPLESSGWGTFTLRATVYLKAGGTRELSHRLVFRDGLPGPGEPPRPPPVRPQGPPRLALTNVARPLGSSRGGPSTWQWTAFLMGEDAAQVHHVVYLLHPTFQPNERRVDAGAGIGHPLTMTGWGTFTLRARVAMNDGRVVELQHPLQFR